MSLLVVGSVAYDGIETPRGKVDRELGGAGTYIALAASHFTKVLLVAVVGDDFESEDEAIFHRHNIDLEGLERVGGKTFYWKGVYSRDMNQRKTLVTELNVFADFNPADSGVVSCNATISCWATFIPISRRECCYRLRSGYSSPATR